MLATYASVHHQVALIHPSLALDVFQTNTALLQRTVNTEDLSGDTFRF
jgi:hypothetical protein